MKSIVIYYSKSGVTEKLAKQIRTDLSADILKVEPVKEYGNYISAVIRAGREMKAKTRVEVKTQLPDLGGYDTVLLGYPIWYSTLPSFLKDFMEKCDVKGKTVIPFSTSGTTNISETLDDVQKCCKESKVIFPYSSSKFKKDDYGKWLRDVGEALEVK